MRHAAKRHKNGPFDAHANVATQEIRRLRAELEASRFEQRRLASSLAHMEEAVTHSGQELLAFKEAVVAREEQYRLQRMSDQKRFEQAIVEYQQKFADERNRLAQALEKNLLLGQRLVEAGASEKAEAAPSIFLSRSS